MLPVHAFLRRSIKLPANGFSGALPSFLQKSRYSTTSHFAMKKLKEKAIG
jgi:hypothetical protein